MNKVLNFNQTKTFDQLPLVIGFFDGLHKGHLKLFKNLPKGKFNILTFTNIPNKFNNLLYSDPARIADLQELSPANIFLLNLQNHNFSTMSFVYKLRKYVRPSYIIVGSDFRFGRQRLGDIKQLEPYFKVKKVDVVSKYKTTDIKKHINNGDIAAANKLLVKPYVITGTVKHGKHMGRKFGYPTANIELPKNTIIPKIGSYKAYTYVGETKYSSAVFIRNHLLETHIFNFHKNIYGKVISIQLIQYHQNINHTKGFASLQKVIHDKVVSIKSSF